MTNRTFGLSRRKFLQLAGTGIAGVVLTACSTPAATDAPKPAEATQAPKATDVPEPTAAAPEAAEASLEFVMNDSPGWADAVNKMMGMYMEQNPKVKVKFTPVAWDQLTVVLPPRFAAKEPPDLLLCDALWPWVNQGLVLDLNPLVEADKLDLSVIADTGTGKIIGDPARYGLPFDFTGSVIAFNKTHFDKCGVTYPKDGWTMNDLRDMAIKLTRDANDKGPSDSGFDPQNIKVYGVQLSNAFFFGALIKMFGGKPWSEDGRTCTIAEANALQTFVFFNDLACKDHAVLGPGGAAAGTDPFASGQAAMTIEGEWQLALYKDIKDFDWDCAAWPKGPKENWQYGGSDALGIAKDSKYIEAAWDFEKFWIYNKEAALATGIIMPPALNEAGLDKAILNGRLGERGPSMENLTWAYTNMRKYADCSIAYQSIHQELWVPVFSDMMASLMTLCTETAEPFVTTTADQITQILQQEG